MLAGRVGPRSAKCPTMTFRWCVLLLAFASVACGRPPTQTLGATDDAGAADAPGRPDAQPDAVVGRPDARAVEPDARAMEPDAGGGQPDASRPLPCRSLDEEACLAAADRCQPTYCSNCTADYFAACLGPDEPPPPCPRPACPACVTVSDEDDCRAERGCHPEYEDFSELCDCFPGPDCLCYGFAACRPNAMAICFDPTVCEKAPPTCPGDDWHPSIERGCWTGWCVPVDLCVF